MTMFYELIIGILSQDLVIEVELISRAGFDMQALGEQKPVRFEGSAYSDMTFHFKGGHSVELKRIGTEQAQQIIQTISEEYGHVRLQNTSLPMRIKARDRRSNHAL